jgi:hypothetical protein
MAGRITMAQYEADRAEAVAAYGAGVVKATLIAGEKGNDDKAANKYFIRLGEVWTNAPESIRKDTARMRDEVESDFEAVKDSFSDNVVAQLPKGSRDSTLLIDPTYGAMGATRDRIHRCIRGIQARKVVLENLLECISVDPHLARESLAPDSGFTWTQICTMLVAPLQARAREEKMKVVIGTDDMGREHLLGPHYNVTHIVETRKLADGTVEEYTTTSFGPRGNCEDVEVVISLVPSGELYTRTLEAMNPHKELQGAARNRIVREGAARNRIIRVCEQEARLPQFMIREARPRSSD